MKCLSGKVSPEVTSSLEDPNSLYTEVSFTNISIMTGPRSSGKNTRTI